MKKVLLVVGLKENSGRLTKFKLAIITPTKANEKPDKLFFKQCVEFADSASVSGVIASAKKYILENFEETEFLNGFYVSESTEFLTQINPVEDSLFARIQSEISVPDMA